MSDAHGCEDNGKVFVRAFTQGSLPYNLSRQPVVRLSLIHICNSEYALEQVYNVVYSRYLSRLPLIITTNLPLAELQAPGDLAHARIYDRVLERCTPVCFSGKNYRKDNAAANKTEAARLLNE